MCPPYIDPKVAQDLINSMNRGNEAAIFQGDTQKPFGIQVITLDLTTARLESNPFLINFPFKSIYVQTVTDSSVKVSFKPNTTDAFQSAVTLGQKDTLNFDDPISSGNLFWSAQSGKSISIVVFVNAEFKSGTQVSVTSGGLTVTEGTSFTTSVVTLAAATAGIVAAANSSRTVSTIQNNTGGPIWLGPSTVTNSGGTLGYQLAPGDTFIWKNTAVLYAYSVAGGDVLVVNEVQ